MPGVYYSAVKTALCDEELPSSSTAVTRQAYSTPGARAGPPCGMLVWSLGILRLRQTSWPPWTHTSTSNVYGRPGAGTGASQAYVGVVEPVPTGLVGTGMPSIASDVAASTSRIDPSSS